jgi:hypothetical protein
MGELESSLKINQDTKNLTKKLSILRLRNVIVIGVLRLWLVNDRFHFSNRRIRVLLGEGIILKY